MGVFHAARRGHSTGICTTQGAAKGGLRLTHFKQIRPSSWWVGVSRLPKRVQLPRRVHHVSVIDPAGQDAEAREVLKRSLLVEVPHDLVRAHVPDRRVDTLC